jgi:hypothetical protein
MAEHDRFGSKADMCNAQAHVCFGSKADIRGAIRHVRFPPESDIKCDIVECPLWAKSGLTLCSKKLYWISSSAMLMTLAERVRPSALADFKLTTSSKRVGCSAGMSPGFAPFRPGRRVGARAVFTSLHSSDGNSISQ